MGRFGSTGDGLSAEAKNARNDMVSHGIFPRVVLSGSIGTQIDSPRTASGRGMTTGPEETAIVRRCDKHIHDTLRLAERMIRLADRGDADREDAGCGILFGVLRDAAYKVKKLAEKEQRAHDRKGLAT